MKNTLILILKGMIIGVGQIIPGVSGGMLAITLGLYEKGVNAISNIFSDLKGNIKFLCSVGFGVLISVIIFSKIIKYLLINFYLPTMLLFIGLILGGIPMFLEKIKSFKKKNRGNYALTLLVFISVTLLSVLNVNNNIDFNNISIITYISFFIVGIIYAATMVIPGVSGTAIMMLIGYYGIIIDIMSNLGNIGKTLSNINIVLPFGIGLLAGIISISKLMNYLLKKHEVKTHYSILGLIISSVLVMFIQTFKNNYQISSIIIGLILLVIGYFISKKLDKI